MVVELVGGPNELVGGHSCPRCQGWPIRQVSIRLLYSPLVYELDLPDGYRLENTFNTSYLEHFRPPESLMYRDGEDEEFVWWSRPKVIPWDTVQKRDRKEKWT